MANKILPKCIHFKHTIKFWNKIIVLVAKPNQEHKISSKKVKII